MLRAAALDGIGIAALPTWAVADELRGGTLRRILTAWEAPVSTIYAVYPGTRLMSMKVRAFVDHLARRFGRTLLGGRPAVELLRTMDHEGLKRAAVGLDDGGYLQGQTAQARPWSRAVTPQDNAPILSGAIGEYREFRCPAVIDGHFQCVWSHTMLPDRGGLAAVVPDGCVDLIWIDGEVMVAGPDVVAALSPLAGGSTVIGVRFRPGAAHKWLGLPMSEITGGQLPLGEFWGARAREIGQRVGDAPSTAERLRAIEAALSKLAPDVEPPPADMGFAFNALKTESAGRGMTVILDRLDVSPRTLRRRCQEAFGYGPKTLDRILRFQRFLNLARRSREPRLADLAFEAGYSDQPHLTHEVQRLSGLSPAAVLRQYAA